MGGATGKARATALLVSLLLPFSRLPLRKYFNGDVVHFGNHTKLWLIKRPFCTTTQISLFVIFFAFAKLKKADLRLSLNVQKLKMFQLQRGFFPWLPLPRLKFMLMDPAKSFWSAQQLNKCRHLTHINDYCTLYTLALATFLHFKVRISSVAHELRSLGERCKLPQRGLGRNSSRNRIWCIVALKYGIWWQQFQIFISESTH